MFFWPWALLLLLLLPLLIGLYRRGLRAKARAFIFHPDLVLLKQISARRRWRSYLAPLLYLLALGLTLVALARPTLNVPEAHPQAGIMLALDVSRSMQAMDILPNRFEAAREALRTFVRSLPEGTRVGLVTFAGYATRVAPLTDDHERLLKAVDLLRMDFGTAIGDALLLSLRSLPSLEQRLNLGDDPQRFATIILLSDGRNFGGVEPLDALEEVKAQKVTVHTVGVGSLTEGPIPGIPMQYQFAARFDEATLRTIATETSGSYAFVDSAQELKEVYRDLGHSLVWRFAKDEATALAALIAAVVLFLSLCLGEWRRQVG